MNGGVFKSYNTSLAKLIHWTGLVTMLIQALYTLLIYLLPEGFRSEDYAVRELPLGLSIFFCVTFVVVGIAQFRCRPRSKNDFIIALATHYLATIAFSIIIPGDLVLTQLLWAILLVATGILLGYRMLTVGAALFLSVVICQLLLDGGQSLNLWEQASYILCTLIVVSFAFYITRLRDTEIIGSDAYERLKNQEILQVQRLKTVINSIDDAIMNVSDRGRVRLYNAATLNLLDTNTDLNGEEIDKLFNLYDESGAKVKLSHILSGIGDLTLEREDLRHAYSDGQMINLHLAISQVRDSFNSTSKPDLGGFIIIARDITKRKSLDDERDEFIAIVSHELRTPVAIMEGALSNLKFAVKKGRNIKSFSLILDDAYERTLFLAKMINDLSTISRTQRGINMDSELINVKEFMCATYTKYSESAGIQGLRFDLDSPHNLNVNTSKMALEEIMQNLITNAIKYTHKDGSVLIGTKLKKDQIEFYVRDTGIGISKSDQSHIFQRFWRSEEYRARETSGTGLGLHIVQQLADKIGTEVKFESRLNHGSNFYFSLPVAKD